MDLIQELQSHANPQKAKIMQSFFKTGKGHYAEGDIFLGLTVPESRKIAKQFSALPLDKINMHLQSKIHEERLIALLILVDKYQISKAQDIIDFYLANTKHVNNWDLVDLTADKILGDYLFDKNKAILYKLAKSESLWERRIAIVSTFHFIKNNQFQDTFKLAELLLKDKHDLIHKAVGWMLREVGKRDTSALENFLQQYYKDMPRTMLRYTIEKFPEVKRKQYLAGEV